MLLEFFAGFVASRLLDGALCLRASVAKPVGRGSSRVLTSLGLLARDAQINKITHTKLASGRPLGWPFCTCSVWANYAEEVTLDHTGRRADGFTISSGVRALTSLLSVPVETYNLAAAVRRRWYRIGRG